MNQSYCEKEKVIIEALRCGTLAAELEKHASSCAICSDTVTVSEFSQSDTAAAPACRTQTSSGGWDNSRASEWQWNEQRDRLSRSRKSAI